MIRVAIQVQSRTLRSALERAVAQKSAFKLVPILAAAPSVASDAPAADVILLHESEWSHIATRATGFAPAIIVLSEALDEALVATALRRGARGVLSSTSENKVLHAAIEAAAAGLFVSGGLRETSRELERRPLAPRALTPREREVLALLASGLPNRIIGVRLGISEHTVKTYVASILEKLGARTRAEAVAIGQRRGLILL
ncbi:MAG TPA: response regulator transcription factor [Gemmatimonadales bacterium]|nr:response regulator transcription factor [Gemmatimonadales bacterium]